MTGLKSFLFAGFVCMVATASAQTVTVNKSGAGDYTTLGAALASFSPDPDPADPNVISITDSGVYSEVITIETPVTIEANPGKATLALLANTAGTGGRGGVYINLPDTITTGAVVLRNLNIIPDQSTDGALLRTAIENGNNNLFLKLDKCVISANLNDAPFVTNGWKNDVLKLIPTQPSYNPAIIQFGDDGIVLGGNTSGEFEGEGVELVLQDTVITHLRRDYVEPAVKPYGIIMENAFGPGPIFPNLRRITRILGDSAVSFCDTNVQVAGELEVDNQAAPLIQMRGAKSWGIDFTGPAQAFRSVKGVIMEGTTNGIQDSGQGNIRPSLHKVLVFQVLNTILAVRKSSPAVTGQGTLLIDQCSFVGGRNNVSALHLYRIEAGLETDVVIQDSIIAGRANQPTNGTNVYSSASTGTLTLIGSAIVTEGIYALRSSAPFSISGTTLIGAASVTSDPDFQTTNALTPGYPRLDTILDVKSANYADKNSVGGPLAGAAHYVGPTAAISDWALYDALRAEPADSRAGDGRF